MNRLITIMLLATHSSFAFSQLQEETESLNQVTITEPPEIEEDREELFDPDIGAIPVTPLVTVEELLCDETIAQLLICNVDVELKRAVRILGFTRATLVENEMSDSIDEPLIDHSEQVGASIDLDETEETTKPLSPPERLSSSEVGRYQLSPNLKYTASLDKIANGECSDVTVINSDESSLFSCADGLRVSLISEDGYDINYTTNQNAGDINDERK